MRAIHLEIVDLSAEEFLLALRRFIARRGKPQQIVLDNAPQFKLTKSSVDVAWENAIRDPDVQSHIVKKRIRWSFVVRLSPWMGRFYERLAGISKMALRKATGKACLTKLQLQTFLTETEAIINSRPLVYLGEDINDRTALTPSHFPLPNTKTGTPLIKNDDNIANPCQSYILTSHNLAERDTSQHLEERTEFIRSVLEVMERRLSIESTREIADKSEITTS